jgi:hypothetical protein
MTQHLNHEQICDILLAETGQSSSDSPASGVDAHRDHLRDCLICASELELLRQSISLFRASSIAYTDRELRPRRLPTPFVSLNLNKASSRRHGTHSLLWAAAALALAIGVPLGLHRHGSAPLPSASIAVSAPAQSIESDEALLEGINQDLSTAVPSPMQALADPTASATQTQSDTTQRTN